MYCLTLRTLLLRLPVAVLTGTCACAYGHLPLLFLLLPSFLRNCNSHCFLQQQRQP